MMAAKHVCKEESDGGWYGRGNLPRKKEKKGLYEVMCGSCDG
jgi:hypothetical protein